MYQVSKLPVSAWAGFYSVLVLFSALALSPLRGQPAEEQVFTGPDLAGARPWTGKGFYNDPANFQFVIVSDRTGGHRDGVFQDAVQKIGWLKPEFVISVGDLIEGYTEDPEQIDREWIEFNRFLEPLEMRFFFVPGNHDIWSDQSRREWESRLGPTYYHFVYKDVLFLCLNSEDRGATRLSEQQVQFIAGALQENQDVRWTLLFLHKPLWYYQETGRETLWDRVEGLLKDRPHTVFAGHRHQYVSYVRDNYRYYELATTGGGSSLAGPMHGRFDHVMWVTMAEDGPVLANLELNGILKDEFRTEEGKLLVDKLSGSFDLSIEPVALDSSGVFENARTHLRITNSADIPMDVRAQFPPHAWLRPRPHAIAATIAANSSRVVEIALETPVAVEVPDSLVVPIDATVTFRPEILDQPLVWQRDVFAVIERPVKVPAAPAVVVDGSLKEWPLLSFTAERPTQITGAAPLWSGPQDLSFRFGVRQDDEYFYLALRVRDDQWTSRSGRSSSSTYQDLARVVIDARAESKRSVAPSDSGELQDQLMELTVIPQKNLDPPRLLSKPALDSVRSASTPTSDGYALEVAIPQQALDAIQGQPWKSLRLNLVVTDVDGLTGSRVNVWWRPNWSSPESYAGSGTFQRK